MNKKIYLIVSLFFLVIVFTSYYFASAATVGVPNPGHTWAEMECSANTLCIDTSTNRLGIGNNNPVTKLEVKGDATLSRTTTSGLTTNLTIGGARNGSPNEFASVKFQNYDSDNSAIDYVGAEISAFNSSGSDSGGIYFKTASSVSPSTRMTILHSGNVGINTTSPGEKLEVNGNVSAAAYYYTSDIRLKDNISFLENSLSKILQLDGISYTLQSTKEDKLGFSAQELQKVFPELVKEGSDGYLSIDGTGLIAPLVEAIKEQQAMIESQQKEINELKNIINNLK